MDRRRILLLSFLFVVVTILAGVVHAQGEDQVYNNSIQQNTTTTIGNTAPVNSQTLCVPFEADQYFCRVNGVQYICRQTNTNCDNPLVKKVEYNGRIFSCVPKRCILVVNNNTCDVKCPPNNSYNTGICINAGMGFYECNYDGYLYKCTDNETLARECNFTGIVGSKVVSSENKTFYCIPQNTRIILRNGTCRVVPMYYILERPNELNNSRFVACIQNVMKWGGNISQRAARVMCGYLAGPRVSQIPQISPFIRCLVEAYKENMTFNEALQKCKEEERQVCPQPKVIPECKNGTLVPIVRMGCVVGYRCLSLRDKLRACVSNMTRQGINRTDAMRVCIQKYEEEIINKITNMSEQQLAMYTHCLYVSENAKEEIFSILRQLREIRVEKIEKIREAIENCSRYSQQGNNTCKQEINNITKYYNEQMRNLTRELVNLTRNITISVNTSCLRERLHMFENITGIHINRTIFPANLTKIQKREMLHRIIGRKIVEEVKKNPRLIREIMRNPTMRRVVLSEIQRNMTLLREMVVNKELRNTILQEVVSNKTVSRKFLGMVLRERHIRKYIIRDLIRNREIKKELLQNKTLLSEILPPKLKEKLPKLKFVDINVTQQGNNTIFVAKVEKTGRLLGIIPVTITEDVEFNDTTVIAEKKPWWAFLVFG